MLSAFIGELRQHGEGDPENLFKVNNIVAGDSIAPPVAVPGCKMNMQPDLVLSPLIAIVAIAGEGLSLWPAPCCSSSSSTSPMG